MNTSIVELEHQRRQHVAQEYRNKGYDVVTEPQMDQLPPFLEGYKVDIFAHNADEKVIIEVKSRPSLINNQAIVHLARFINQHPGWRFELVVIGLPDDYAITEEPQYLTRDDIWTRISQAEQIMHINAPEAALLFTWATIEALFRLLAKYDEIELRRSDPRYLINQLTTYGVLSREEYQFFTTTLDIRNTIAHGLKSDELLAQLVRELIERATHLLELNQAPAVT